MECIIETVKPRVEMAMKTLGRSGEIVEARNYEGPPTIQLPCSRWTKLNRGHVSSLQRIFSANSTSIDQTIDPWTARLRLPITAFFRGKVNGIAFGVKVNSHVTAMGHQLTAVVFLASPRISSTPSNPSPLTPGIATIVAFDTLIRIWNAWNVTLTGGTTKKCSLSKPRGTMKK